MFLAGSVSCGLSSYRRAPSISIITIRAAMSVICRAIMRCKALLPIAALSQGAAAVYGPDGGASAASRGGLRRRGRLLPSAIYYGRVTACGRNGVLLTRPTVTSFTGTANWLKRVGHAVKCLLPQDRTQC